MNLAELFDEAITKAQLSDQDSVAREYARSLCVLADRAHEFKKYPDYRSICKELLTCLKELGMTPTARAAKNKTEGGAAKNDTDDAAAILKSLQSQWN